MSDAPYFCPFCGGEAYRGHRDYKCATESCENYREPVFPMKFKPLNQEENLRNLATEVIIKTTAEKKFA